MMKNDKSKRTVLAFLCLYLAIGIVAIVLFNSYGSKMSRSGTAVEYNFFDDGKAGEPLDAGFSVMGESGAKEEAVVEEAEESGEEEIEETPSEKVFYSFVVTTKVSRLRIRIEPNIRAKILDYFKKGETGYILEKGEKWSYVTDGTRTGYCSNEFLDLTEISIDELPDYYPDEYKVVSSEEIDY